MSERTNEWTNVWVSAEEAEAEAEEAVWNRRKNLFAYERGR